MFQVLCETLSEKVQWRTIEKDIQNQPLTSAHTHTYIHTYPHVHEHVHMHTTYTETVMRSGDTHSSMTWPLNF